MREAMSTGANRRVQTVRVVDWDVAITRSSVRSIGLDTIVLPAIRYSFEDEGRNVIPITGHAPTDENDLSAVDRLAAWMNAPVTTGADGGCYKFSLPVLSVVTHSIYGRRLYTRVIFGLGIIQNSRQFIQTRQVGVPRKVI